MAPCSSEPVLGPSVSRENSSSSTALNNVFDAQNPKPICRMWSGETSPGIWTSPRLLNAPGGRHVDASREPYHSMLHYVSRSSPAFCNRSHTAQEKQNPRRDVVSRSAWRHFIEIDRQ